MLLVGEPKGMIKEAIHCYVTAVRLMPKFAAVHSNLGSVLKEQGKLVRTRTPISRQSSVLLVLLPFYAVKMHHGGAISRSTCCAYGSAAGCLRF